MLRTPPRPTSWIGSLVLLSLASCDGGPSAEASTRMNAAGVWVGNTAASVDGQLRSLAAVELSEGDSISVETQTWPEGQATEVRMMLLDEEGTLEAWPMQSLGQRCATFSDECNNELWTVDIGPDRLIGFSGQFWIEAETALGVAYHSAPPTDFHITVASMPDHETNDWIDLSNSDCWLYAGPGRFEEGIEGDFYGKPGGGLGMRWCARAMPASFELEFDYGLFDDASVDPQAQPIDGLYPLYHNSGVLFGFPDPRTFGYDNEALVAVHWGYEVQIDDRGHDADGPNGEPEHSTGIVYEQSQQSYSRPRYSQPNEWRSMRIVVTPARVQTFVDGLPVADWSRPSTLASRDGVAIGAPSTDQDPRYIGFQTHTNTVGFRRVRVRAL